LGPTSGLAMGKAKHIVQKVQAKNAGNRKLFSRNALKTMQYHYDDEC
jgi:hypothetical protein